MPVVQPVLGAVTNTHTHIYIYIYIYIYMIIVGKSVPIDNYEQYKRAISQIIGRLHKCIYILETKKLFHFLNLFFGVCMAIYNSLLLINL